MDGAKSKRSLIFKENKLFLEAEETQDLISSVNNEIVFGLHLRQTIKFSFACI